MAMSLTFHPPGTVHAPGRFGVTWNFRGWLNLYRNNARHLAAAGPDGPAGTVRYEALREGIQEAEARIAIERALAADGAADRVGAERIAAFEALQLERLSWRRWNDWDWSMGPEWKARALRLYRLAGEITREEGGSDP